MSEILSGLISLTGFPISFVAIWHWHWHIVFRLVVGFSSISRSSSNFFFLISQVFAAWAFGFFVFLGNVSCFCCLSLWLLVIMHKCTETQEQRTSTGDRSERMCWNVLLQFLKNVWNSLGMCRNPSPWEVLRNPALRTLKNASGTLEEF